MVIAVGDEKKIVCGSCRTTNWQIMRNKASDQDERFCNRCQSWTTTVLGYAAITAFGVESSKLHTSEVPFFGAESCEFDVVDRSKLPLVVRCWNHYKTISADDRAICLLLCRGVVEKIESSVYERALKSIERCSKLVDDPAAIASGLVEKVLQSCRKGRSLSIAAASDYLRVSESTIRGGKKKGQGSEYRPPILRFMVDSERVVNDLDLCWQLGIATARNSTR